MKKSLYFAIMALLFGSSIAVNAQEKVVYPTVIVDGHTYTTDLPGINLIVISGESDKSFMFSIRPDAYVQYRFTLRDAFGFPSHSLIASTSSASVTGTQFITITTKNRNLPLEYTGKKKVYRGYLPIHIHTNDGVNDTNILKLPVTITVKPAPAKPTKK
jgi:hypothetical protein